MIILTTDRMNGNFVAKKQRVRVFRNLWGLAVVPEASESSGRAKRRIGTIQRRVTDPCLESLVGGNVAIARRASLEVGARENALFSRRPAWRRPILWHGKR
jgi:hypothetical protein